MEKGMCSVFVAVFICLVANTRAQGEETCTDKVTKCTAPLLAPDNPSDVCPNYESAKACMDGIRAECGSDAMFSNMETTIASMGQACTGGGAGGSGNCMMDAGTCMTKLGNFGSDTEVDPATMCVNYDEFKTCYGPVEQRCMDDPSFASLKTSADRMKIMCESDCKMNELQECIKDMQHMEVSGFMTVQQMNTTCKSMKTMMQCMAPILEACKPLMAKDPEANKQMMQQQDMANKMGKALCNDELPTLLKYSSCIDNPDNQMKFDNCDKMYGTPPMEQGVPKSETEDEQCQRMKDMSECIVSATKEDCGEDAAQAIAGLNQRLMSIKTASESLNCPTDAASGLVGHLWTLGISVFLAVLLL